MSGLVALFARDGSTARDGVLAAMVHAIRHRGPDSSSQATIGPVALGHCMLETTPEDALSSQPLRSTTRDHWIVSDARLDNRAELGARCLDVGAVRVEGFSDAALILEAYARWGRQCARKLLGDFAFVIWDAEQRQLYCARDPLGIRPLFYRVDDRACHCASETKALFADPDVPRRPHWLSMALFLCRSYTENGQTLYEGIFALPGGHSLSVTESSVQLERYWKPDPWRRWAGASDDEYAERFGEVFREAVRCRMRSSRRLGVQVSGGLDSSSVAAEACRLHRAGEGPAESPWLVRIVFPGLACDESSYSQAVADRCGGPITSVSAFEHPDGLCPHVDPGHPDLYYEPTGQCLVSTVRAARALGIRTTLTGHGGDLLLSLTGVEAAGALRAGRLGEVAGLTGLAERPLEAASWQALYQAVKPLVPRRARAAFRPLLPQRKPHIPWITGQAWRAVLHHYYEPLRRRNQERYPDEAARAACACVDSAGMKYWTGVWDRIAGANGAEFRHPFLDLRLVELLLAMPWQQRTVPGQCKPKPVLRRAMRAALPEAVLARTDAAEFTCYVELALRRHPDLVRSLFAESRLAERGILDGQVVRRILGEAMAGGSRSYDLITAVALELWLRNATS